MVGVAGHGIGQRPEQIAPADHLADLRLHAAEGLHPGRARSLTSSPAMKSSFTAKPRAALEGEAVGKARARIELLQPLDVAMDEHVLPGDEGVVEDEDGVVLVEAAGSG